jgi:type I restriction enzyme, S subunit
MSRYKAYPEYKGSGVEWLDTVPAHWSRVAIKYMALEEGSLFLDGDWIESKDISTEGIKYVTTGNVGEGIYKEQGSGFITEEIFNQLNCTDVFPGDVLISRLNAPIGRACVVPDLDSRIVTSVDNVVFRPDHLYSKEYLVRLFSSPAYFEHTTNLARGATMQRISRGLLGNIRVVLPLKIEQQKIAAFLDHETAKIDALIEKQQRLIELLKEKRQAVISHAVTKGLNPNAPMKDSGVEWLGNIPCDWDCVRLKFASELSGKKVAPSNEEKYVGLENIQANSGKFIATEEVTPEGISNVFSSGDILFGKLRPYLAKSWLADFSGICSSEFLVLTSKKVNAKFLHYFTLTQGFIKQVDSSTYGSKMPRASWDFIGLLNIPIPSYQSEKIAAFLDHETAKIDTLIEKQQRLIELSKERRTALISAAVTGKIDVRDWQAPAVQEAVGTEC